jgi:cytidylate kinase
MRHIAITGDLQRQEQRGEHICQKPTYDYFSTGALQRKLAAEKGMNTLELNYLSEKTNEIDDYIDAYLKKIDTDKTLKKPYVLDSRLAWHFVKSAFKVYLKVQPEIAAKRVFTDTSRSSEPQAADLEESKNSCWKGGVEARRFKKLYNIDYRKPRITTCNRQLSLKPEEGAAQILAARSLRLPSERRPKQIQAKGISTEQIRYTQSLYKASLTWKLAASASTGNGTSLNINTSVKAVCWKPGNITERRNKVIIFVPARSCSRMFKDLYAFLESDTEEPVGKAEKIFISHCGCFAFSEELNKSCTDHLGASLESLQQQGRYKDIIRQLLLAQGLNYGALPKGLLSFHKYPGAPRKAMPEHLAEAALYAPNYNKKAYVHFTVSPEHTEPVRKRMPGVKTDIEQKYGLQVEVSFSVQKASTDTIAADQYNQAFRDQGKLLFRPAGTELCWRI